MRKWYRGFALLITNALILFVAINCGASLYVGEYREGSPDIVGLYHLPKDKLRDEPAFMRKVYPGRSDDEIAQLIRPPNISSHPTLEFRETPVRSRFYNVGFEGMRYTGHVGEKNAKAVINGSTWVFGGSTTFGHGIADDETIAHHLDTLDTEGHAINFGVQGSHQNLEVDKLILLLKKGYRPKRVVFIDGLNDVLANLNSNFAPEETPMLPFNAYSQVYNVRTLATPKRWTSLMKELPLGRLLYRMRARGVAWGPDVTKGVEPIDDPDSLYVRDPRLHFERTPPAYEVAKVAHIGLYAEKLIAYYRANLDLLGKLAEAYGFELQVVLQPIGLLNAQGPFIRDARSYGDSVVVKLFAPMVNAVRAAIADGRLGLMIDLSAVHDDCRQCYVDLAHYDSKLCERIAGAIATW